MLPLLLLLLTTGPEDEDVEVDVDVDSDVDNNCDLAAVGSWFQSTQNRGPKGSLDPGAVN